MRAPRLAAAPAAAALLSVCALSVCASSSLAAVHEVAPGESLSSIAAIDGLSTEQLAGANGLPASAELIAGTQLVIPAQGGAQQGAGEGEYDGNGESAASTSAPESERYVVQPGDTLTSIAARDGATVEALAAANGLDPGGLLLAGSTLTLPGAGQATTVSGSSPATSQPVGEAAEGSPGDPPYTTPETVSPEQVAFIAAEHGVPGPLADAIAYQESGFNNALTSSADARGVMQITPGTWSWIDESLAGQTLAPAAALDNVRGGVLLLHSLLEATGGNEQLAIAGYYQGLPSVQQEGAIPSTQQYVADVQALQERFGGP